MLFGWMKSLIIYLIFAGLIINLSPSGSYKKYIRFFTGTMAIIIIMKPISYIFDFDEEKLFKAINNIDAYSQIASKDTEVSESVDYFDMSISEAIRLGLVDRGFNIEKVIVLTDENEALIGVTVYVSSSSELDRDFEENNIKKYINEVYNLNFDNIYVVRR